MFVESHVGSAKEDAMSSTVASPKARESGLVRRSFERLDEALERAIQEQRIVGAVVAIVRDGEPFYRRAVGQADREAARPMTEQTLFRIASLTKPVVSLAAMTALERGELTLDDEITRWLPDFRPSLRDGRVLPITVRQLLTHTSGLGYGFFDDERARYDERKVSNGLDQPGLCFADNAERLSSVPLFAPPGTEFRYSLSTDVLGEVVAKAAGLDLPSLIEQRVTGPLGMRDTSFRISDVSRLAVPYADAAPQPRRMSDHDEVAFPGGAVRFSPGRVLDSGSYPSGGSGLVGSAEDYLRFAEALRTADPRILSPALYEEMRSDQISHQAQNTPIPGPGWGFGFGLAVLRDPVAAQSPLSQGAWRWEGSYGHTFWIDPVRRISAVALTNTTFEGMAGKLPADIIAAATG
jgi:CubicO group peptidase (beta-lactamase class C family)